MKTAIDRALEWFDIEKYRRLDECTDVGLLAFISERFDLYDQIREGAFRQNAGGIGISLRGDPGYEKIFSFDADDYFISLKEFFGDSFGSTPDWLKENGYCCVAVKPLSVVDIACANDDLRDGSPANMEKDVFDSALDISVDAYRRSVDDEELDFMSNEVQALNNTSHDQYLFDYFGHHTGHVSLQVDLSASDDQILNEVKDLLPLLRRKLKKTDDSSWPSHQQAFSGPLSDGRIRKSGVIDGVKARRYRIPALIDLHLWSLVEEVDLSRSDYLRLVFPGDNDREQAVTENKIRDTYLPYIFKCLDVAALSAFGQSLKAEFVELSKENKNS